MILLNLIVMVLITKFFILDMIIRKRYLAIPRWYSVVTSIAILLSAWIPLNYVVAYVISRVFVIVLLCIFFRVSSKEEKRWSKS